MTWEDNLLATLPSEIDCGQIVILKFYTKSGTTKKPLDILLFNEDIPRNKLTIKSTDVKKIGEHTVYYEIGFKDYPANLQETKSPFKLFVTKNNSAPTLSGLSSKMTTFAVDIPVIADDQTVSVGMVEDVDGDNVKVEFSDFGNELITYN